MRTLLAAQLEECEGALAALHRYDHAQGRYHEQPALAGRLDWEG
ncbi:MAG: hypothetical protein RML47_09140 [Bacteroidota bacterium]|nr:hypothetical protein [Bacteroidota bacterium]